MLMSSDLRGEIEEPSFYFKKEEEKAELALDYLLMTQGWRRIAWEDVLENTPLQVQYEAEKAIVKGKVLRIDQTPIAGATLTILETEEQTTSKSDGTFEFRNLNLSSPLTLRALSKDGFERIIQINDYSQEYQIGGKITGIVKGVNTDDPLPGVSIYFEGTKIGTVSDANGKFELERQQGKSTIITNYVGFQPQKIDISNRDNIEIKLEESLEELQEMVVVGFGNDHRRRRKNKIPNEVPVNVEFKKEELPKDNPEADKVIELNQPEIIEVPDEEEIEEEIEKELDMEIIPEIPAKIDALIEEDADEVFVIVENQPQFQGGMQGFYKFIEENIYYPKSAREAGVEGRVFVQFAIDPQGNVSDVQVIKGVHEELDRVAKLVMENSPKWLPGRNRGRYVKTRMAVPIIFKLDNTNIQTQQKGGLFIQLMERPGEPLLEKKSRYDAPKRFYVPQYKADEQPTTRTDFRETIYWNPDINLNKKGKAKVVFYNSDEVTQFRATLEGIAGSGMVGRTEHTYFTQLPFAMDIKVPAYLAFEDQIQIPVFLKNNTNRNLKGKLNIEIPPQLKALKNTSEQVQINANSVKTLLLPYEVLAKAGKGSVRISFESEGLRDEFSQIIEVKAKGFPVKASFSNNVLEKSFQVEIKDLVKNSLEAKLVAYPDPLSDLMSGIESILREPYGCFEQTSSSTYPNVLAMLYMEETQSLNPAIREKAYGLIDKGYKRLISYETKENGYEWFGNTPPHEGLTAYGLMEFTQMSKVYNVDEKMLKRTQDWLLSRRDGKGGFELRKDYLHTWNNQIINAYVTYALSEAGYKNIKKELEASLKEATESQDIYRLALVANTLYNLNQDQKANLILKDILKSAAQTGWDKLKAETSVTSSQGKSLQVETAAFVLMAMLKAPQKDLTGIQKAVEFLVSSRQGGGFGSTQATILALEALTDYARFAKKTEDSGQILVYIDNQLAGKTSYEKGAQGEILIDGLAKYLSEGTHTIKVKFADTESALPYSVDLNWTTYTPNSQKDCKVDLNTKLTTTKIKTGETIRLSTTLQNKTDEVLPMTVALVGIPSGLSAQPWQLKELQEKGTFDFYEIKDNYVYFYYTQLDKKSLKEINLDLKAEVAGDYEAPASTAYLYYTNELKDWAGGERVVIQN